MTDTSAAADGGQGQNKMQSAERLVSIGQLVSDLQPEFPDLSISKVRYLEDRGLLSPQRTKGRYRKYSKADIRRLRNVLAMQRDEYLPLEVIKKRVEVPGTSRGGAQTSTSMQGVGWTTALHRQNATYTFEELSQELGAEEEYVSTLVEFGLIKPMSETGPAFTEGDLETARICLPRRTAQPAHAEFSRGA